MMATVALIALGFGVTFEVRNRAERARLLRRAADRYREAAVHMMQAMECQRGAQHKLPYPRAERAKQWAADGIRPSVPAGGFNSWEHEGENHEYWGRRAYDEIDGWQERLKALESRMLLP
jgi:hypothetical protein